VFFGFQDGLKIDAENSALKTMLEQARLETVESPEVQVLCVLWVGGWVGVWVGGWVGGWVKCVCVFVCVCVCGWICLFENVSNS